MVTPQGLQVVADRTLAVACVLSFVLFLYHFTVAPGGDQHGLVRVLRLLALCLLVICLGLRLFFRLRKRTAT